MIASKSSERKGWPWARRAWRVFIYLCCGLVGTALGTAAGGWLGWQGAPPLTTLDEGMAFAAQVVPGQAVIGAMRTDGVWSYHISGANPPEILELTGDIPDGGYVEVDFDGAMTVDRLVEISTRLRDAGWTVHSDKRHLSVSARKEDVLIMCYPSTLALPGRDAGGTQGSGLVVEVDRAEPARVVPLTIAAGLVGLSLGVQGSVFLHLRVRRRSLRVRRRVAVIGLVSLAALVPGTVLTLARVLLAGLSSTDAVHPQPSWGYFVSFGVKPISLLGVVGLATAAALSLVARHRAEAASPFAPHNHGRLRSPAN